MFGSRRKTPRVKAKDIALPAAADEHPFSIVKGGYSVSEVAAFVSGMSADMTTLTPQELRRVSFTIERRGYDKAEVFAHLNRVAAEIEAELDAAREQARRERIITNDPTLAIATRDRLCRCGVGRRPFGSTHTLSSSSRAFAEFSDAPDPQRWLGCVSQRAGSLLHDARPFQPSDATRPF